MRAKYRTIVADPPWSYDADVSGPSGGIRAGQITRSIKKDGALAKGIRDHTYSRMSVTELAALPVTSLAEPDAHLYLWTTNAFMVEAHEIARAWGFTPKTILTWGKVHQDDRARASMKTGYWFRGATEHAIFAVRGSLRISGAWPTLLLWPRIGQHSVKPDAFYDMVEQASPGPYLEMFSRRHRFFWDVWGNESANTASLEVPV